MIFANTDKEITLIYFSEEHLGRQILAFAQIENIPIRDIDLVHMKLTPTQWSELASRLGISVRNLVNTEHSYFKQRFGNMDELSDDDWFKLLEHNPGILIAPIVLKGDKIKLMNNPQDMLYFVQ